jgi:hypothetical protein
MVSKRTGKPPGRPVGPVMDHPDRYFLAQADAQVAIGKEHGNSERAVLKTLVGIAIGTVVPTPDLLGYMGLRGTDIDKIGQIILDNHASMSQGLPFRMWTLPLRLPPEELKRDRVEDERYRDAFTPYVYDLQHQLRRLRRRDDPRGVWHRVMARVLRIFIEGDATKVDLARRLATTVGEIAFFERELLPRITADVERRAGQSGRPNYYP